MYNPVEVTLWGGGGGGGNGCQSGLQTATCTVTMYWMQHNGRIQATRTRKKRVYEERVREVEHGSFSALVFSTSGGMGPMATVVYRRLASMIAERRDEPFS